ncbi:hypothetical protein GCM10020258_56150 [Sphingomonas yabuuchiae]
MLAASGRVGSDGAAVTLTAKMVAAPAAATIKDFIMVDTPLPPEMRLPRYRTRS